MKYSIYAYVKDTLGILDIILRSNNLETKHIEDVEVDNDTIVISIASSEDEEKLEMTFSGCNMDHVVNVSQNDEEMAIKVKCAERVLRIVQKVDENHQTCNLKEGIERMGREIIKSDFSCKCAKCFTTLLSSEEFKTVESSKASVVDIVENIWCLCGCSNKDQHISASACKDCKGNDLLGKMTVELNSELSIFEKCFVLDSQLLFYSKLNENRNLKNGEMKVGDDMKITCGNCDFLLGFSQNSQNTVTKSSNPIRLLVIYFPNAGLKRLLLKTILK